MPVLFVSLGVRDAAAADEWRNAYKVGDKVEFHSKSYAEGDAVREVLFNVRLTLHTGEQGGPEHAACLKSVARDTASSWGGAGSYDDKQNKESRSLGMLLREAGVSFATHSKQEHIGTRINHNRVNEVALTLKHAEDPGGNSLHAQYVTSNTSPPMMDPTVGAAHEGAGQGEHMPNQRVMTYKGLDSQVFEMDSNAKSSSVRTQLMTSGFIGEDSPTEAWRFFIYIVFYFFVFKSHEDAVKVIGQINAPNPSVWD